MPVGTCALCLERRQLHDSHFLPAGFYRIIRSGQTPNENPVLVSKTAAFLSSAQASAHLLCSECEERFNKGGEDWVLKNCWHSTTMFPLHSALSGVVPFVDDKGFRAYDGTKVPGVEIDRLAYFGASVFWRASVHDWRVGKDQEPRLSLGPYQNSLRHYLLGTTGMPDGVVLLVTLSNALDDLYNRVAVMPWFFNRTPEYRHYKFLATGLTFQMLFGRMIPKPLRRICSARRGFLFMSEVVDAAMLKTMATMTKRAQNKGKLAKEPRSDK